ncbi:unnamed protein product [Rhizopus stolonifer]
MTDHFPLMLSTYPEKFETPSIEITQRLGQEQYDYEFPPRSTIMAITERIQDDQDEFFDECSFTSVSEDHYYKEDDNEEELNDLLSFINESFTKNDFVSDHQLSPLQLPLQYIKNDREESLDSTGTVQPLGPSSFLSAKHRQLFLERVPEQDRINWDNNSFIFPAQEDDDCSWDEYDQGYHSVHPYHTQEKVILIKISKSQPPIIPYDEGYDDCLDEQIESASVFLPLSDEQTQLLDADAYRHWAATKIQSVWRGHRARQQTSKFSVLSGLALIHESISARQRAQVDQRLRRLEQRLNEETAMRVAFEKAMEDMTVLMDHQHKVMHDRLEQEIGMRQTYEQKMEDCLGHIQPLESRLRHEAKARADMESMMSRVLDQLHEVKTMARQEAEEKKLMEKKLEDATAQIAMLKLDSAPRSPSVRPSAVRAASVAPTVRASVRAPSVRSVVTTKSGVATKSTMTKSTVTKSDMASRPPVKSVRPTAVPARPTTVPARPTTRAATRTPKTRPTTPSNILRRTTTPKASSNSRAAEKVSKV